MPRENATATMIRLDINPPPKIWLTVCQRTNERRHMNTDLIFRIRRWWSVFASRSLFLVESKLSTKGYGKIVIRILRRVNLKPVKSWG